MIVDVFIKIKQIFKTISESILVFDLFQSLVGFIAGFISFKLKIEGKMIASFSILTGKTS